MILIKSVNTDIGLNVTIKGMIYCDGDLSRVYVELLFHTVLIEMYKLYIECMYILRNHTTK